MQLQAEGGGPASPRPDDRQRTCAVGIVEVDGSSTRIASIAAAVLAQSEGLWVLRFDNVQVLKEIEGVMEVILRAVAESLDENPP